MRNQIIEPIILALTAFVLCASCTKVDIVSVRDASFQQAIQSVFILVNTRQVDKQVTEVVGNKPRGNVRRAKTEIPFSMAFSAHFSRELKATTEQRIRVSSYAVTGLELNPNIAAEHIAAANPDVVLMADESTSVMRSDSFGAYLSEFILDLSLLTFPEKKRVWRAEITVKGGRGMDIKKVVTSIIAKLREDKII